MSSLPYACTGSELFYMVIHVSVTVIVLDYSHTAQTSDFVLWAVQSEVLWYVKILFGSFGHSKTKRVFLDIPIWFKSFTFIKRIFLQILNMIHLFSFQYFVLCWWLVLVNRGYMNQSVAVVVMHMNEYPIVLIRITIIIWVRACVIWSWNPLTRAT